MLRQNTIGISLLRYHISMGSASSGSQRIAFFGGSFDPPHLGHIAVARAALRAVHLDKVLFAPVGLQPLKPTGASASFEDRVAMTRLAIAGDPGFELSLLDVPRLDVPRPDVPMLDAPDLTSSAPTPNYTLDTLTLLRESLPADTQLFLLLGADSFFTFHHWHGAAEIPFHANLIVASRPVAGSTGSNQDSEELMNPARYLPAGVSIHSLPNQPNQYRLTNLVAQESQLIVLPGLNYDISATQLRSQIQGQSGSQPALLDPAVLQYIQHHHLYQ